MYFNIKNNTHFFRVSLAAKFFSFCLLLFVFTACGKNKEITKEEEHHEESAPDMVEVTPVQFKAAQIVYGGFEMKNLSEVITANGYTKLPPQNQADVSVFVNGVIKNIMVIEGQAVRAGQTIATYQSLEYNNIRLERARLIEELQAARLSKDYLDIEYARQKELSEAEVNARKIFQKVSSDLAMEKKKIETIGSQLRILDENLKVGGNSASALIAIRAPIGGFITSVNVKIGSNVTPNNSLFSIVDNREMHVDLLVYEKDLFKVKEGQDVRFVLTNQGNQEIIGKIFSIGKAFQNETKAVAVHADINNKDARLISGMYVNALIDIGNADVNTLPLEAVVKADGKEYIFIAAEHEEKATGKENKKAEEQEETADHGIPFKRIEVKTGTVQLGFVQVTPLSEVAAGVKIVVKGAYYLQSTMTNAEGGDDHGH
ncbi:MAG: efflux RND transporter periplasmic adaptor subunit [Bacteroidota bacterium]